MIKFLILIPVAAFIASFLFLAYILLRLAWIGRSLDILRDIMVDYMCNFASANELELIDFSIIFINADDALGRFWSWSKWSLLNNSDFKNELKAHEKVMKERMK